MALPLLMSMAASGRRAGHRWSRMPSREKAAKLRAAADAIRASSAAILAANRADMAAVDHLSPAMRDRLRLDRPRVDAMAAAVAAVAALPDPVGQVIDATVRPNGLALSRVRVPIGLIGIIFESRPNVTADAAALCAMSGNAAILRGGSEAVHSNRAIHEAFLSGLDEGDLPGVAIQLVPTQDREEVSNMLAGMGRLDLIIPRGGKGLVSRVQKEARVPVLAHLEGINHVYVHASADLDMAARVVIDAKMRRPAVCGAMETLLIDRGFPHIAALATRLAEAGCELICDYQDERLAPWNRLSRSRPVFDVEHLGPVATVLTVHDLDAALDHIACHGSGHTDAIVATDAAVAERFLAEVDSAIVLWNASTQFADGGEFGLGAEIGIATGRLHARGPVALEGLTTYKWIGRGTGQVRG